MPKKTIEIAVYIILLLASLLLIVLALKSGDMPNDDERRNIFLSIGTSIMATLIVSVTLRALSGDPFEDIRASILLFESNLSKTTSILDSSSRTGVTEIWTSRSEVQTEHFIDLLKKARHNIDLLGYAIAFLPEHHEFIDLVKQKSKMGCKVRILLGHPKGHNITRRNEEEADEGSIAHRIVTTLIRLVHVVDMDNIDIKLHDVPLYCSIYRYDSTMIVTNHLYGLRGALAPTLKLKHVNDGMFKKYNDHFDTLWELGSSINKDRLKALSKKKSHILNYIES